MISYNKNVTSQFGDYIETLKERSKTSRVYKEYQLTGLELSELLHDEAHKALYIKLAKTHGRGKLISIAKEISKKKEIKNKGAYFMRVLQLQKEK